MNDSHTDTLISCLCVICAIHLLTSNRTSWGNATGVPRQKKFTSKASSRYYYSLVYFLTTPYCYQHSASFSYRAGTKHWIMPDNKVATKYEKITVILKAYHYNRFHLLSFMHCNAMSWSTAAPIYFTNVGLRWMTVTLILWLVVFV